MAANNSIGIDPVGVEDSLPTAKFVAVVIPANRLDSGFDPSFEFVDSVSFLRRAKPIVG